jgi:tripartite ATP-independent transporter DctM subunit
MWALIIMLVLLLFGAPIWFGMAAAGVVYFLNSPDPWLLMTMIPERMFTGMDSFVLMAIPFFMLAGELMNYTGISDRIIAFTTLCVGRLRGGLGQVNVASSMLFAGITGVAVGDILALGSVFIPAMEKEGYHRPFAAGLTASSSLVGPLIPPSIIIVVYGAVMEMSIATLFAATIVPGVFMGLANAALVAYYSKKRNYPKREVPVTLREFARTTWRTASALMFPIIIVGGIVFGVFTPTEAAAIAVAYAVVLGFGLGTMTPKAINQSLYNALRTAARIFLVIGGVSILSWMLANEQVPEKLVTLFKTVTTNKYVLLLMLNAFFLFMGMWMTGSAEIILFAPIVTPLVVSYGIDPFHWAVIMIVNLVIGLITPPLGIALYAMADVARLTFSQAVKAIFPFLAVDIAALLLITYFPPLTLTLPGLLGLL